LRRIEIQRNQRAGIFEIGLERERAVALEEAVAVADEKMSVVEHPQVAGVVVDGPPGLGHDRTGGQSQQDGLDLAGVFRSSLAALQAGYAKGKQYLVFAEKIERYKGIPHAQIQHAGSGEAQSVDRNGEGWRDRGFIGKLRAEGAGLDGGCAGRFLLGLRRADER
jgi:hypothetical protein